MSAVTTQIQFKSATFVPSKVSSNNQSKSSSSHGVAPVVRHCYDVLDLCPDCGISDFTDGKYVDDRNNRTAYLAAQHRQAEYLLD